MRREIHRGDTVRVAVDYGPESVKKKTWDDHRLAEVISFDEDSTIVSIPEVSKTILFRYPNSAVESANDSD